MSWCCRVSRRLYFSSRRRHTRFKCDWSSDVCSSDLSDALTHHFRLGMPHYMVPRWFIHMEALPATASGGKVDRVLASRLSMEKLATLISMGDRKSVVWGKSVDLGGRRIIKKKKRAIR